MKPNRAQFAVGRYRPIYLWGGPGTIRMARLKFPNLGVDESAHRAVHTVAGASTVVDTVHANWVHLMYDWGFPPEVEREDWESFRQAAAVYHSLGSPVFGYIQTSNCVRDGSFREKGWYAADPTGRLVPHFVYRDRFMVCLDDPEWRDHLREMIRGAIERGADGIFFDNILQGDQPIPLAGAWLGSAGCHCERCRHRYALEHGREIPIKIEPASEAFQRYLRWRAAQVTELLADLAQYVEELQPGTPVSANDYDPIVRDAYLMQGIDLEALGAIQDVTMIENYGLPSWNQRKPTRLVNNALTIRNARRLVRGRAHLSVLSYDAAIGFDPVYPVRRYLQGIAEAAACGASMTTKGTEYNDGRRMTLLTAPEYAQEQRAIGQYHRWLENQAPSFGTARRNAAPVALIHPGEKLWFDWFGIGPVYHGAAQALTIAGIPWRVVRPGDSLEALTVLLAFDDGGLDGLPEDLRGRAVVVPRLTTWQPVPATVLAKSEPLRWGLGGAVGAGTRIYTRARVVRAALDRVGAPKSFVRSKSYCIPHVSARRELLAALRVPLLPRVRAKRPVLIETWRWGDLTQIHLVNYAEAPQIVELQLGESMVGQAKSPDGDDGTLYRGSALEVMLDVYKVLELEPHAQHEI